MSQALMQGSAFVGVNRSAMTVAQGGAGIDVTSDDEHFYLAINRKALAKKWFLSAFMKQYFPGAVKYGAARSLGTRVVSFKIQNDKLYVFSADSIKKTSDTFDPEVIIDAYPLVTGYAPFNAQPGSGAYVLIDPAAGMNRFNMASEASGAGGVRFEIELAFVQRLRPISDGLTYELAFTGYADGTGVDWWASMYGEDNTLRGSGTLGMALREYRESPGFEPAGYSDHYFSSDLQMVANTGFKKSPSAKWAIAPGMEPIVWKISPQVLEAAKTPELLGYDVVQAMKNGVLRWNDAFGFEALRVEIASADESYADDDVNYLIFDKDPSYGAAFANWRTNPNTGEIRGASVYFNAGWFGTATGAAKATTHRPPSAKPPADLPQLAWGGMKEDRLCTYAQRTLTSLKHPASLISGGITMTEKQKFEEYVTHVVLHEVGHTLGLRHNFRGSLLPPSSSVMDYLNDDDTFFLGHPQAYDVDAIRFLYGLSKDEPKQPFCTDGGIYESADCNQFDTGAVPLVGYAKDYSEFVESLFDPTSTRFKWARYWQTYYYSWYLTDMMKFVRDGTAPHAENALAAIMAPISVGLSKHTAAADQELLNELHQIFLRNLYLDAPRDWGALEYPLPTMGSPLATTIIRELKGTIENTDKVRTYGTRRVAVDSLKAMQSTEALEALRDANLMLAIEATRLAGATLLEHQDLMGRIDAAMHPYFLK
ncbi:MAG: zinc-dependent metalloprotease [Deltaproteobacteria bacterium]|nr:zinc-dependent metalloprotease [Deltaproteobacteria bacterium]